MTATREAFIECDHGGRYAGCPAAYPARTVTEARRQARDAGWCYRNGKDYCPDHARLVKGKSYNKKD
jgi:hypothetical protein